MHGGCTTIMRETRKRNKHHHLSKVFLDLKLDLLSLLLEAKRESEGNRIKTYAEAIRHLRLLHPYERLLRPPNDGRYCRILPYFETREEYQCDRRDEEFFREYAPPNDVLKELAKIARGENGYINKSQIENFIKLAEFHERHYSTKYAESLMKVVGGF